MTDCGRARIEAILAKVPKRKSQESGEAITGR